MPLTRRPAQLAGSARQLIHMRILFVCHRLPFPPNRGGKIRPFQMIRHLAQRHFVTVATLAHTEEELQQGSKLREHCEKLLVEVLPSPVRWARALAGLPSSKPSSREYFWSPRLQGKIVEACQVKAFDRIWVHCAFMARYVTDVRCDFKVLDYGDIDSSKWADYRAHRMFPLSLGYGLEAWKLRRYETKMARRFTRCTVTTDNELKEFESLGVAKPCAVIRNGVDIEYFNPDKRTTVSAPALAFVGRMDYFPNVDGVLRFVDQSWPKIRAAVPDAELRIVGSNPVNSVARLAGTPGVVVTGHVPDIRPYLADAAVGIAPLRIARGTQNKVLEMMSMGLPVVTSTEAARGIRASSGEHLMVAGDDHTFVRYTLELLRNRELRTRLSEAGRTQVVRAHSWPASMKIVDEVLQVLPPAAVADQVPGTASAIGVSI